jgi:transposase-like protein
VLEQARERGLSLAAIAGVIGVAQDTIYEWRKVHSDFSEACSRARSARILWWELKLGRSRKGAETTASIFALKNAAPDEWRDVRHTEHTHALSPRTLTDQQLEAIAAGVSPADAGIIDGSATRLGEK